MKSFLQNNDTETYLTNEGKSAVAERFIWTFKNKIYKYMISRSKNMYIDKLDDIVNKYNNTYHKTVKMKTVDVNPSIYIDFNKGNNKEGPKFKVGDNVRISKYENILANGYVPNWSQEVFMIKKVKNAVPWTYVINNLDWEEIVGKFYKREMQKTNKKRV